jgi:hypothetical protein
LSVSDKLLFTVLVEYGRLNKPFFHISGLKLRLLDEIDFGKSNLDKLSMLISH